MGYGGARKGAGRPQRYGEPTKQIRVPLSAVSSVLKFIAGKGSLLPLYDSKVAAGSPVEADDHSEASVNLNDFLVKNPSATFLVRVSGHSMKDAGINENDILIVDRSIAPSNGKVVVAAVDGLLTVKRISKTRDGKLFLMPENSDYSPIEIKEGNDIHVWGVVTNAIHAI